MVRDYLNALKNKGNFTVTEVSKVSGVPEATIRRILSGETPDARFETVAKLVAAMGGSLDDAFSTKKEKDIEANVVTELKSGFEIRIESLRERLDDLRERIDEYREREAKAGRVIRILAITVAVLVAILVAILIFDLAVGAHGWVQY